MNDSSMSRGGGGPPDSRRLRTAKRIELVPIDHGLSLPRITALDEVSCSWVTWRQSKKPLSAENRAYVLALDGRKDALLLHNALGDRIRPPCLLTLRVCTALLQEGVAAGLTLAEIGLMMVRGSGVGLLPSSTSSSGSATASGSAGPSGRHYSFDSDGGKGGGKGGKDAAEPMSALELAVKKAQASVKKEAKTTKVHAERAALQTLAAHWQRLSAEIAHQMKQQQLATNTTAATTIATGGANKAAAAALSGLSAASGSSSTLGTGRTAGSAGSGAIITAMATATAGSSNSSASGTPASASPFMHGQSGGGVGVPNVIPPPLSLSAGGSGSNAAPNASSTGNTPLAGSVTSSSNITTGVGPVAPPPPPPSTSSTNISSAARLAAADAALLSVATSETFKQAAALAAAAGGAAAGVGGGTTGLLTLSPDRAAAVAEAAQRQLVRHQLIAAAQPGKKPWNVKKGKGANKKKQHPAGSSNVIGGGNPLVNAMTPLLSLPSSLSTAGAAGTALLPSPTAQPSSSSSPPQAPAPSFFSYHDAVVRHFVAAIRPHIEAVIAKRQSTTNGNYLVA
jgi:hypothetical protein